MSIFTGKTFLAACSVLLSVAAFGQKKSDPAGALTYCLPATTVRVEVGAVQERFYAGPYAKYAEKYLGIRVRQSDETVFHLTDIRMTPYVEADYSRRYSMIVEKGTIDASFLRLSSEGLVSFGDAAMGNNAVVWRFPTETMGNFSDKGVSSNLMSESAVLYRNDKKDDAYGKVSVQQNVIVAKTVETKAAETAEMILKLRRQRLQIVTGDTDATYSGEAMGAAIEELTRLEKEYMTLFTGYSESQMQNKTFDVIPKADRDNQRYVVFRVSDTQGLVGADNLTGRPIVMEFIPQPIEQVVPENTDAIKKVPSVLAWFRIPAICTVRLTDGVEILLQSRIPVYQLGQESSMPVNVILK